MWRDSKFPLIAPEADSLFFGPVQLRLVGEPRRFAYVQVPLALGDAGLVAPQRNSERGLGWQRREESTTGQLCGEKDDQWKVAHPATLCRPCSAANVPVKCCCSSLSNCDRKITQDVGFHLEFLEPVFHDIADANDADKPVLFHHR